MTDAGIKTPSVESPGLQWERQDKPRPGINTASIPTPLECQVGTTLIKMTEHKDNHVLPEEEMADHNVTKADLDRYRECCRSWETAYNAALANITQLSARVSYLEKMLCAAQIGNQQTHG